MRLQCFVTRSGTHANVFVGRPSSSNCNLVVVPINAGLRGAQTSVCTKKLGWFFLLAFRKSSPLLVELLLTPESDSEHSMSVEGPSGGWGDQPQFPVKGKTSSFSSPLCLMNLRDMVTHSLLLRCAPLYCRSCTGCDVNREGIQCNRYRYYCSCDFRECDRWILCCIYPRPERPCCTNCRNSRLHWR